MDGNKYSREVSEAKVACAFVCVIAVGWLAWALLASQFEASAWNRLTGGNATMWDALWVELRVDCSNSGQ